MYRKVAYYGLVLSLALIVSYVEVLVPVPIPIPGVKLGLANGILLFLMYKENIGITAGVSVLRIVLVAFLFGNMASMLYSLGGAVCSLLIMYVVKRTKGFSIVGVSMAGGVFHNIGQLLIAMCVTGTTALFYYLPVLMIAGVITGCIIGILMLQINKSIRFISI